MQKKSVIIPIVAIVVIIGWVFASSGLFPDTASLPRVPIGPGTIGWVLYSWFESDGSAKNTNTLSGITSSGYLQNNNCTDPINNKWSGVDANGRGICGNGWAILAAIGKFSEISGVVEVLKYGTSIWVPANTTDDLYPGDIIRTDSSGTGTIQFAMDDSLIRLFTDTTLELQMGNLDGNSVAEAILSDGRLWWRILSSTGVNLGGGGVVTGVRGTSVDVLKVANLYTVTITDSVNSTNKLKTPTGIISAVKDGSMTIPNLDFWKGTRFMYMSGDVNNVKKIIDDKNNFYTDPWFRKNTRFDVKYMSDLLDSYWIAPAMSAKKSRLAAELDTTIESNNVGTLYKLLQDSTINPVKISAAVGSLDQENQVDVAENSDTINKRKPKRLNCKMEDKTYFPELDDCKGSWNSLSVTNFAGSATGTLFWKKKDWDFVVNWFSYDSGIIAKIKLPGQHISYTWSFASLNSKKIQINLHNPVWFYVSSPTGDKWYVFDGGSANRFFVYKGRTCAWISDSANKWLCKAGSSTPIALYTWSLDLTIEISWTPTSFIVGNAAAWWYNNPIGATIDSISIE
jgi:hypothetical protein